MTQRMSENIIKSYPELSIFDVEYEGEVFDCRKCLSIDKCCGSQNLDFNNNLACIKCRCQYLYDVIDNSRENKVTSLFADCANCDPDKFTAVYCENYGMLNNNLKANITDCSNNFLNLGISFIASGKTIKPPMRNLIFVKVNGPIWSIPVV